MEAGALRRHGRRDRGAARLSSPTHDVARGARDLAARHGGSRRVTARPGRGGRDARRRLHRRVGVDGRRGRARARGCATLAPYQVDARADGAGRTPARSSCTACPRTAARRSPPRSSTGRSRWSSTRPPTACRPSRRVAARPRPRDWSADARRRRPRGQRAAAPRRAPRPGDAASQRRARPPPRWPRSPPRTSSWSRTATGRRSVCSRCSREPGP